MHIENIYASILQYQTLNSIWTLMYDCCSYLAYEPKYIFQKNEINLQYTIIKLGFF